MSEVTNRLQLPYIMPAQAMKHVTHNEALQRLDTAVQLAIDVRSATPPPSPTEGMICYVEASPDADWTGKAGSIAFWQDDYWQFIEPMEGWLAYMKAEQCFYVYNNGDWEELPLPLDVQFNQLGVGATADSTNRLAVSSEASLLNHGSSGSHQLKVNKQAANKTASLLFQSAWTGHAEMGLAGDTSFSIKQSPDGANWFSALTISGNGIPQFPSRPMVKATHISQSFAASSSSRSGFSSLTMQQGGFSLGTTLTGTMKEINVPASGHYLAILHLVIASATTAHGAFIAVNALQRGNAVEAPISTTPHSYTLINILQLSASDKISIGHTGTSSVSFGGGKTELTLLHIG